MYRTTLLLALLVAQELTPQCGGSPATTTPVAGPATNVQAIVVNAGPANNYFNGAFTSVTICAPGQSTICSDDRRGSGRYRFERFAACCRLRCRFAAAAGGDERRAGCRMRAISRRLHLGPGSGGRRELGSRAGELGADSSDRRNRLSEHSHRLHRRERPRTRSPPWAPTGFWASACSGRTADPHAPSSDRQIPVFFYYVCPSGCQPTAEALVSQLQNPVALLPMDNNGVLIQLPAVARRGAVSVTGALFGIGTQTNNALGAAKVIDGRCERQHHDGLPAAVAIRRALSTPDRTASTFCDAATTGLPLCSDTHRLLLSCRVSSPDRDESWRATVRRRRQLQRRQRRRLQRQLLGDRRNRGAQPGRVRLGIGLFLRSKHLYRHRRREYAWRSRAVFRLLSHNTAPDGERRIMRPHAPAFLLVTIAVLAAAAFRLDTQVPPPPAAPIEARPDFLRDLVARYRHQQRCLEGEFRARPGKPEFRAADSEADHAGAAVLAGPVARVRTVTMRPPPAHPRSERVCKPSRTG